jgi:hypothetical protein
VHPLIAIVNCRLADGERVKAHQVRGVVDAECFMRQIIQSSSEENLLCD